MSDSSAALPLEIDCSGFQTLRESSDDVLLLDCREQDEYDTARIAEARLLPMSQIADRVAELDEARQQRIVVHCHHGGRSLRVVHWLRQQGFDQAQSLAGGIDEWSQKIDPSIPRY